MDSSLTAGALLLVGGGGGGRGQTDHGTVKNASDSVAGTNLTNGGAHKNRIDQTWKLEQKTRAQLRKNDYNATCTIQITNMLLTRK